jgi:hypothetical protein
MSAEKEAGKINFIDKEFRQNVNGFLRDFYSDSPSGFYKKFQKHYLSLGKKIDKADLGFTQADVKAVFERLKFFADKLKEINSDERKSPFDVAREIAEWIEKTPTLYRDLYLANQYSLALSGKFPKQDIAFRDESKPQRYGLNDYCVKFIQWLPLKLGEYKNLQFHDAAKNAAMEVGIRLSRVVSNFNGEVGHITDSSRSMSDDHESMTAEDSFSGVRKYSQELDAERRVREDSKKQCLEAIGKVRDPKLKALLEKNLVLRGDQLKPLPEQQHIKAFVRVINDHLLSGKKLGPIGYLNIIKESAQNMHVLFNLDKQFPETGFKLKHRPKPTEAVIKTVKEYKLDKIADYMIRHPKFAHWFLSKNSRESLGRDIKSEISKRPDLMDKIIASKHVLSDVKQKLTELKQKPAVVVTTAKVSDVKPTISVKKSG